MTKQSTKKQSPNTCTIYLTPSPAAANSIACYPISDVMKVLIEESIDEKPRWLDIDIPTSPK
ncbi:predicted protein [Plenodomus lingam JN3]|uniref:Predicted protein n=1 Tax=Leptosphaeria maculans (strain JN3 / isolate v23.1.3 / race Av1-4-5-6-7-8) TaxID=985895 RepID=E4ZTR0_LEPMJ|nr:predicted protein [Plenodomus lingam JN3]CBX94620.1 predicted protein [Plenodomus lingam JN3]